MVRVRVICVGRLKEPFYREACAEYEKRLRAFCMPEIVEIPEERTPSDPSRAEIDASLRREAEAVRRQIPPRACVLALTPEGEKTDSPGFARMLAAAETEGDGTVCFLIGSSFGLDPSLKQAARRRVSMSDMVFPHHLARVMLLEQLYRAFCIRAGGRYHK